MRGLDTRDERTQAPDPTRRPWRVSPEGVEPGRPGFTYTFLDHYGRGLDHYRRLRLIHFQQTDADALAEAEEIAKALNEAGG